MIIDHSVQSQLIYQFNLDVPKHSIGTDENTLIFSFMNNSNLSKGSRLMPAAAFVPPPVSNWRNR
jgi:hypothetical protein